MPIPGGRGKENPMTDMMLTWKQGVYAFDRKDYGSAVEHFSEVLASEPGNLNCREYLARAQYHRASLGPAVDEARRILEVDPTNEYVTMLLARALERQGKGEEAVGVRRVLAALSGDDRHAEGHHAFT